MYAVTFSNIILNVKVKIGADLKTINNKSGLASAFKGILETAHKLRENITNTKTSAFKGILETAHKLRENITNTKTSAFKGILETAHKLRENITNTKTSKLRSNTDSTNKPKHNIKINGFKTNLSTNIPKNFNCLTKITGIDIN